MGMGWASTPRDKGATPVTIAAAITAATSDLRMALSFSESKNCEDQIPPGIETHQAWMQNAALANGKIQKPG